MRRAAAAAFALLIGARLVVGGLVVGGLVVGGLVAAAPAHAATASAATAPAATPAATPAELDAARRQCIADARRTEDRERRIAALRHAIVLIGHDADGRRRGLDESRAVQEHLLGVLEFLARNRRDRTAGRSEPPLDRLRGELLVRAAAPALRREAHALVAEYARIAALRREVVRRRRELAAAREALLGDRARLAQAVAHRGELRRALLPADPAFAARIARLGHDAPDLEALIKGADAALERRDRELLRRAQKAVPRRKAGDITIASADPTRPATLNAFEPPKSALRMPVAGVISRLFDRADGQNGLGFTAMPGAVVVAPFDGRVIYAGPYRDLGPVLILQYGRLYHSLFSGLGRLDATAGEWVLAGEPLGAMPVDSVLGGGGVLQFEMRRDGHPVDPQPWLAPPETAPARQHGDQKVRQ